MNFLNILFEENIDILSSDGTAAAFNTQETADLLKEYKQYTDQGVIPKNNWGSWDESLKLFESGKLAIVSSSGSFFHVSRMRHRIFTRQLLFPSH